MRSRRASKWFLATALAMAPGAFVRALRAQIHHVDAPEHVTRAVGVYEWTGELNKPNASRFVPVSLFIDGHFEDAGLYLARPVPFALQNGDLYTVEHSGEPQGTLDLQNAQRVVSSNALAADEPAGVWYGFGTYTAQAEPKPGPALRRSAHVGVIQSTSSSGQTKTDTASTADTDDGKPHMSRRGTGSTSDTGSDKPSTSSGGGTSSPSTTGGDDTDRPTLARRDPSQDAARRRTAVGGKAGTASVSAVGPQPGDDPDRPTLSHHTAADDGPQALTGMPADLHQAVAVSDAASRDTHPFARPWDDAAERSAVLASLAALAKPKAAAYLAENRLVPSTAIEAPAPQPASTEGTAANTENGSGAPPKLQRGKPTEYSGSAPQSVPPPQAASAPAKASAKSTAKHPSKPAPAVPLALHDEQVSGFTLSYGGLPTFVYTASVPAAVKDAKDLPPTAAHPTVYLTLVAQRLPSGDLQVALSSVTDSLHLDRTPRFRLVDVVDPDASHRGNLLFELRGNGNRQFALYRLTSARAENTFTSASIE